MVDVNVSVAAEADNGFAQMPGYGGFDNTADVYGVPIGDWNGTNYHDFFRFDNVAIPAGVTIDTAVVRFEAGLSNSGTCTVDVYFEDADDPAAPVNGSDLSGRSLTGAVSWSPPSWTDNTKYDTSDLSSILQDVIDRPGWASGQAIIVHVKATQDNFNYRFCESYATDSSNTAQLRVTYTQAIEVDDSVGISESLAADIGIREIEAGEELRVTEFIGAELFQPWLSGSVADDLSVIEYLDAALEEIIEPSLSQNFAVIENIAAEMFLPAVRSDLSVITENIAIALDIPPNWVALANAGLAVERYYLTVTGAEDSTTDIDVPMESFQARKRTGLPTYLSAVVRAYSDYLAAIQARPNGQMIVKMAYEYRGLSSIKQEIIRADLETIDYYDGPVNRSVVLNGNKTNSYINRSVTLEYPTYKAFSNNELVYRFAKCSPYLNPGDTCVVGSDSFTVGYIVYMVDELQAWMEVREGSV